MSAQAAYGEWRPDDFLPPLTDADPADENVPENQCPFCDVGTLDPQPLAPVRRCDTCGFTEPI